MQCPSGKDEGNEDNAFLNEPGIANYCQNLFPLRVILLQMVLYNASHPQSFISSHRQQLWPRQVTALQYQQLTHTITSDSFIREALIMECSCFSITMSVRDFTERARVSQLALSLHYIFS
jgi:hypothetical protein